MLLFWFEWSWTNVEQIRRNKVKEQKQCNKRKREQGY